MRARFLAWCRRVQWSPMIHWELGLSVDYDGAYEGSGVLVRLQWPGFITRWTQRFLPPVPELDRADISDILITSLVPGVMAMAEYLAVQHATAPALIWPEDRLSATDG